MPCYNASAYKPARPQRSAGGRQLQLCKLNESAPNHMLLRPCGLHTLCKNVTKKVEVVGLVGGSGKQRAHCCAVMQLGSLCGHNAPVGGSIIQHTDTMSVTKKAGKRGVQRACHGMACPMAGRIGLWQSDTHGKSTPT
jgi:hypothetical protein